jgi:hypothetical protein
MVRLAVGLEAPGAGVEEVSGGVMPVRTAGIPADGRTPGIRDGRGDFWAGAGAVGFAAGMGLMPDGRVGVLADHAVWVGAGAGTAAGPRSMMISP